MIVSDVLNGIKADTNYVINSLIVKSFNDDGCTFKWLTATTGNSAIRKEIFIATSNVTENLEDRTVITAVEIGEAQ